MVRRLRRVKHAAESDEFQQGQGEKGRRGCICCCISRFVVRAVWRTEPFAERITGREAETNRKIAIKKIRIGQFKDGLDMSAIREVKYLRELKHENIIEVSASFCSMTHA